MVKVYKVAPYILKITDFINTEDYFTATVLLKILRFTSVDKLKNFIRNSAYVKRHKIGVAIRRF